MKNAKEVLVIKYIEVEGKTFVQVVEHGIPTSLVAVPNLAVDVFLSVVNDALIKVIDPIGPVYPSKYLQ